MNGPEQRGRRELAGACLLTALGGVVMLIAAGRTWSVATLTAPPLPARRLPVTGADLSGAVRALALVALAGVAALVALPGRWRVVGGLLLGATGIGAVFAFGLASPGGVQRSSAVTTQRDSGAAVAVGSRTGWPYGYLAGAFAVTVAGGMTAAGSRRWPGLGARYDAPAARATPTADPAVDPWAALDRGEDPTDR